MMNKRMLEKIDAANDLIKALGITDTGFSYYSRRRVWFCNGNKRCVIDSVHFTLLRKELNDLSRRLCSEERTFCHDCAWSEDLIELTCPYSHEKRDFTDIEPLKETADLSAEETT